MESTSFGIPIGKRVTTQELMKEQMAQQKHKIHQLEIREKELLDENRDLRKQLDVALGNQCACPE